MDFSTKKTITKGNTRIMIGPNQSTTINISDLNMDYISVKLIIPGLNKIKRSY